MKYTTFCKTLVIASMTTILALAQPPGRGFGPRAEAGGAPPAPTVDNAKQYLGLSDTDVASLEAMRQATMQAIQPLAEQVRQQQDALHLSIQNGSATASSIGTATLAIEVLHKQIAQKEADAQVKAAASLTAAQQTKLKTLQAAIALAATVREANVLGLVTPPEGMGPGGPGGRGPGGRGPGF